MTVVLHPVTGVLVRDTNTEEKPHGEEAEMGRTQPHSQGCLEPPEPGRGRKQPPLDIRAQPGPHSPVWTSAPGLQSWQRTQLYRVSPWCGVTYYHCPRTLIPSLMEEVEGFAPIRQTSMSTSIPCCHKTNLFPLPF